MSIDFNNVRVQALLTHDKLVRKLNANLCDGCVNIPASLIQDDMDELRVLLSAIANTYKPDDEDFKLVYPLVYREGEKMVVFNADGEDEG